MTQNQIGWAEAPLEETLLVHLLISYKLLENGWMKNETSQNGVGPIQGQCVTSKVLGL
jgi:hypothetical protein